MFELIKPIAIHTTPENDEWRGKGFAELTNVNEIKPLFRGHFKPQMQV